MVGENTSRNAIAVRALPVTEGNFCEPTPHDRERLRYDIRSIGGIAGASQRVAEDRLRLGLEQTPKAFLRGTIHDAHRLAQLETSVESEVNSTTSPVQVRPHRCTPA